MNYNVMCETEDYGLSENTKYYANLFQTKTNINNSNHYNDCQIVFRVFHISSTSGISLYKDYILTTCKDSEDIVNLIDLNPHVKEIEIGYNISPEGDVVILGKGSIIGAKLKIQVLYSPTIGMFEFFNCSSFTNNITCIQASNKIKTDRLHLINNWNENAYTQSYYRVKDGVCYVNVNIYGGNTTEQIVIADNLPIPISNIQIACCDSDGKAGVLELISNGHLRVKKLQSTKDTMCTFSYLIK